MSDKLRRFTKAVYAFDAVVNRVAPDQWDAPTACDDWTTRGDRQHGLTPEARVRRRPGEG